jgi:glucuronate isomerase
LEEGLGLLVSELIKNKRMIKIRWFRDSHIGVELYLHLMTTLSISVNIVGTLNSRLNKPQYFVVEVNIDISFIICP